MTFTNPHKIIQQRRTVESGKGYKFRYGNTGIGKVQDSFMLHSIESLMQ